MEKKTPHCRLAAVKAMVEAGKVRSTKAAREGGAVLSGGLALRWILLTAGQHSAFRFLP